jgi:hypothetical protein
MKLNKHGGAMIAASLPARILMIQPMAVTHAGKTIADTGAPLLTWETVC